MPLFEMEIDSVRTGAKLTNQRVLLLKQKSTKRYLPIYIDSQYASILTNVLKGRHCLELMNDEVIPKLHRLMGICESASLIIDRYNEGIFHAKFVLGWREKSFSIECPIGKALLLCVRARVPIFAEEEVLDKAGVNIKE